MRGSVTRGVVGAVAASIIGASTGCVVSPDASVGYECTWTSAQWTGSVDQVTPGTAWYLDLRLTNQVFRPGTSLEPIAPSPALGRPADVLVSAEDADGWGPETALPDVAPTPPLDAPPGATGHFRLRGLAASEAGTGTVGFRVTSTELVPVDVLCTIAVGSTGPVDPKDPTDPKNPGDPKDPGDPKV